MPESDLSLNLFYAEPDPDRWVPFDRFPRRLIRRIVRGNPRPGGQKMVFLNLCKGLDRLGVSYRVNDYRYVSKNPDQIACIVGKPNVLLDRAWRNPVLFGASIFSHPLAYPDLLERHPVQRVLVPGEWMRRMCEPYYADKVKAWPVGIDTDYWMPNGTEKTVDFLVYSKFLWHKEDRINTVLRPVQDTLRARGHSYRVLTYGNYSPGDLKQCVADCRAAIFFCEHETQGIAYQQILSAGVPILAWDRQGVWEDPEFYPHLVQYEPVTGVPYWDDRCGVRFGDADNFSEALDHFLDGLNSGRFAPRDYILENLTLEKCAEDYLRHVLEVTESL